jgi:hypothetical protein
MTFKKDIKPDNVNVTSSTENVATFLETDSPTPVGNLFPEAKAIEKAYKKDAGSAEAQKTVSADKAKQIMLSLRTLSPLIVQFLNSEKTSKTSDQKRSDWLNIITLNRKNALVLAKLITLDAEKPKFKWLLGMCQRFVAEIESQAHQKNMDWDNPLLEHIVQSIENDIQEQKYTKLSSNIHIKIATVKATSALLVSFDEYDLKHTQEHKDANLKVVVDKLVFTCVDALESLVAPLTPENERHVLFGVLMDEATILMNRTLKEASEVMNQTLMKLEKKTGNKEKALQELIQKRPEGYPLDNILKDFSKKFVKLVNVSKHYHPSK